MARTSVNLAVRLGHDTVRVSNGREGGESSRGGRRRKARAHEAAHLCADTRFVCDERARAPRPELLLRESASVTQHVA